MCCEAREFTSADDARIHPCETAEIAATRFFARDGSAFGEGRVPDCCRPARRTLRDGCVRHVDGTPLTG
jgi:hypothetical protein